jgi:hypothetical protein
MLPAITAEGGPPSEVVSEPASQEAFRLKVHADAGQRDWLSAEGFDIAGHDLADGWVEVIVDRAGLARLRAGGFTVEILERRDQPMPLGGAPTDAGLPDTAYTDPGELETFLNQVVLDHSGITRLEALGTTHEGRTIWGLMISDNAAMDEDEPTILFSGTHHAREVMTVEVVMDIIDHLTDNYGVVQAITDRVDAYQIWCVPIVNPDGVNRVFVTDDFWRKNLRDNDGSGTITSNDGVDLNRNYEWGWGYQCQGSSGSISSPTYRGPHEGSEPETQAMVTLGRRIRPVFDVEYHSYGEDVFYALSCDPQFSPKLTTITGSDKSISRVIAEGFAAEIVQADGGLGFFPAPYGSRVDGTGRDQQYHESGAIGFVTEVNSSAEGGFHPSYATWRDATVEGQRPGWLWLIDRIAGPAVGGHVLDAVTGLPVEADVSLDEMQLPDGKRLTSRGDTGRFHIIVVEGNYTLRVTAPGYQDATVNLVVGSSFLPVQVDLVPTGSSRIVLEDFEDPAHAAMWTFGDAGDTATDGLWVWDEPQGTHNGTVQTTLDFGNARLDRTLGEGRMALVTGNEVAAGFTTDDVDGGVTTVSSPPFDLSGLYAVEVSWQRWFRKDASDPVDDLVVEVSDDGGSGWTGLEDLDVTTATVDASPAWVGTSVRLDDLVAPGPDIRFRFRASDTGTDNTVEAAVDDLEVRGFSLSTQGDVSGVVVNDAADTVVDWNAALGAPDAVYDIVRGDLSSLSEGPGGIDLGTLTCIESDSVDTTTAGDADTAVPSVGAGFFYLIRFELGLSVGGYGPGTSLGERSGTGGCSP